MFLLFVSGLFGHATCRPSGLPRSVNNNSSCASSAANRSVNSTDSRSLQPSSRMARAARAYDGVWNVAFATQAGNCSSTNTVPFTVSGSRVSSASEGA